MDSLNRKKMAILGGNVRKTRRISKNAGIQVG